MITHKATFTTGDIAHLLGVTARTVGEMIDKGHIRGFKLPSGDRRVPKGDLVRYLRSIGHTKALEDIGE